MSSQWQRRTAVAALLWGMSHMALADGVTIGGDLNINIGAFTFCGNTQQVLPPVSIDSNINPGCALEASQIVIDPYGHRISTTSIDANGVGTVSAPRCSARANPRVRNRLLGTHVVGCQY